MPNGTTQDYIGDGVYTDFDGFHVWLKLDPHERGIGLEPQVILCLAKYIKRVSPELAKAMAEELSR